MANLDRSIANLAQVTIAGTGLLGGSIGLALRAAGFTGKLVGVGRRQVTLDAAVQSGCIDRGTSDLTEAVNDGGPSQLVILATPLGAFASLVDQLAKAATEKIVITDVGSVKAEICHLARTKLPHPQRFVGSHPMAGGEQHGPQHARADLFAGRPCVITREAGDDDDAVQIVTALWQTLGMKLHDMDVAEHDRRVALISHLPHAAAALLVNLAQQGDAMGIASTGFRDTTRVASGDVRVWTDIFLTNQKAAIESLDAMGDAMATFREAIAAGDEQAIQAMLQNAKQTRDTWLDSDTDTATQDSSES